MKGESVLTENEPGKKRIPLRKGRFEVPEDPGKAPYLIGSKCAKCLKYFSGKRYVCLSCESRELEEVPLSGKGKIYTYTVVHQQMPGALVRVPYALAVIVLEEGCQIHGVIEGGYESLDIDTGVEVYFQDMKEDEEGNALVADLFRICK